MKKRIVQISRHSVCYFFMLTSIGCSKLSDQLGVETKAHTSTTAVRNKSVRRSVHAQRNSEVVGIPKMKTLLTLLLILSNPMPVGSNCCHYGTAHTHSHSHINCCRNLSSNSNRNIGNFPGITAQWYQDYINNNIYDENNARSKILNDIITFGTMIETKYDRKYNNLVEEIKKWDESWNSWNKYNRKMKDLLEEEKQFQNSSEESDLNSNIDMYTQRIVQEGIAMLKQRFQSTCPQFNFEDCMRIVHECLPGTSGKTVSGLSYLNQLNKLNQYGSDTFYLCPFHQTSVQCKNVGDQCVPFIFGTAPKEECSRKYKESWCSNSRSIRACNAMIDACADAIHQENLLWVCHALCTSRNNRTIVSDLDRNCLRSQAYPNPAIDQRGKRAIRLDRSGRDAKRKDQQNKYRKNQATQKQSYRRKPFFIRNQSHR